jgi:Rieske Fe-S protein
MDTKQAECKFLLEMPGRRQAVARLTNTITGLMSLGLLIPSALYIFKPTAHGKSSKWSDAGALSEFQADSPQEITFRRSRTDGWRVQSEIETAWVSREKNGRLQVFSPSCPHLGCAYRWDARTTEFVCPCHGSRFDRQGQVLAGPAAKPLERYETKIVGGRLWLAS